MKHVGAEALDRLEPLLVQVREVPGIKEKKRGTFYRKSKALLHFHMVRVSLPMSAPPRNGNGFG
jgi:hypothetical protein